MSLGHFAAHAETRTPLEQLDAFGKGNGTNPAFLLLRGNIAKLPIPGEMNSWITWDSTEVTVHETVIDSRYVYEVELSGAVTGAQKSLMINYKKVPVDEAGHFTYKLVLTKAETELLMMAVQATGKICFLIQDFQYRV